MSDSMNVGAQGGSGTKKWLIGCGVALLVAVVLCVAAGYLGTRYAIKRVDEITAGFEEQGFTRVTDQMIEVGDPITEKTVFFGQIVKIVADCETDVAIVSQLAEIQGHIQGTLYFRGQKLTISKGAVIDGDLDVKAQFLEIRGLVIGDIVGTYDTLDEGLEDEGVETVEPGEAEEAEEGEPVPEPAEESGEPEAAAAAEETPQPETAEESVVEVEQPGEAAPASDE